MAQQGYQSYFIVGEQAFWNTAQATLDNFVHTVYEFQSSGLRNVSAPASPNRIRRIATMPKVVPQQWHCEGDINMHLHADRMLIWLKYGMGNLFSSSDFTPQEVRADAAYTNGVAFSLDTQPTATSPTSDPGKLIFTFTGATGPGSIAIAGTDQNDVAITETVTVGASPTTVTSTKYFKTVNASGITITGMATEGTVSIDADRNVATHIIDPYDDLIHPDGREGLTIEMVKGLIPNTYHGLLVNSWTLTMAETMNLSVNLLGRYGNLRTNLSGGATPTDYTTWTFPNNGLTTYVMGEAIYPAWGFSVSIDGVVYPVANATLTWENNLAHPNRVSGTRYRPKPVRTGKRSVTFTVELDYDVAATVPDWDVVFENNNTVDLLSLSGALSPLAGPAYAITFTFGRGDFLGYMDPEVNGDGDLTQTLNFQVLSDLGAITSNEAQVTLVTTETGLPSV